MVFQAKPVFDKFLKDLMNSTTITSCNDDYGDYLLHTKQIPHFVGREKIEPTFTDDFLSAMSHHPEEAVRSHTTNIHLSHFQEGDPPESFSKIVSQVLQCHRLMNTILKRIPRKETTLSTMAPSSITNKDQDPPPLDQQTAEPPNQVASIGEAIGQQTTALKDSFEHMSHPSNKVDQLQQQIANDRSHQPPPLKLVTKTILIVH